MNKTVCDFCGSDSTSNGITFQSGGKKLKIILQEQEDSFDARYKKVDACAACILKYAFEAGNSILKPSDQVKPPSAQKAIDPSTFTRPALPGDRPASYSSTGTPMPPLSTTTSNEAVIQAGSVSGECK